MKKTLSWKPKRTGRIYCSPACGHDCTHAVFQQAHKDGKTLAERMRKGVGGDWKVRVWENGGWHYCAILGEYISIHEHGDYWADINTHKGQWHHTHKNPIKALEIAKSRMQKDIQDFIDVIRTLE